jgi:Trypsin-like peptidase domain
VAGVGGRGPGVAKSKLAAAVAQVLDADDAAVGTGFLIAGDVVFTCAHVVVTAGGGPGQYVWLRFPQLDGAPRVRGQVLSEGWGAPEAQDVAVVRLDHAPAGAAALELGASAGCRGHPVRSFGFPAQAASGGHYGYGVAGDLLTAGPDVGTLLQLTSANDLTQGFSGGPVLDDTTGVVIGMLTAITRPDIHQRGAGIAYATPTETLREIWAALAVADVCPYRGLEPFTAEHAVWFYGRADAVQKVLAGIAAHPRALLLRSQQLGDPLGVLPDGQAGIFGGLGGPSAALGHPPPGPIDAAGAVLDEVADHRPAGVRQRARELGPAAQHLRHRRGDRVVGLRPGRAGVHGGLEQRAVVRAEELDEPGRCRHVSCDPRGGHGLCQALVGVHHGPYLRSSSGRATP